MAVCDGGAARASAIAGIVAQRIARLPAANRNKDCQSALPLNRVVGAYIARSGMTRPQMRDLMPQAGRALPLLPHAPNPARHRRGSGHAIRPAKSRARLRRPLFAL